MPLADKIKKDSKFITVSLKDKPKETLEDLREDEEFVKKTERFLNSLGEGQTVGDLYQYFRGSDFNIKDTLKVASQANNFTQEQKEDYLYLSNRFYNADTGSFKEKAQLGIDATQELLSDPLNWASAFLIPWTGGTSVAGKLAGGEAAKLAIKESIKQGTNLGVRKNLGRTILNTPGQVLKSPLSKKQLAGVLAAEGAIYGGTHNYVNQSIQLTLDQRDERDYSETALVAGVSAVAAPVFVGGVTVAGKAISKIPSLIKTQQAQRYNKIDNNENYKSTFLESSVGKTLEVGKNIVDTLKLTTLPLRPTSFLKSKAKKNKILQDLLSIFRYDAAEGFIAPTIGKQIILQKDYDTQLRQFWGDNTERLIKILGEDGYNLLTFENKRTSKFRKNFLYNSGLSDNVNNDLAFVLRSGKNFKIVNGKKVKINKDIIGAASEIRLILDDIYDSAIAAGLKPNRAKNYFPRFWNIDVIKRNKEEFIDKIIKAEGSTRKNAEQLWKKLSTEGTSESSSASGLSSRLKAERILNKIDDEEFGKFLFNDVESILKQYFAESSALITRTKLLGETTDDFTKRFIIPIEKSGLKLTDIEKQYLKTMYEITTGQRGRINTSRRDFFNLIPTGKIGAVLNDGLVVTMQTSLLGLSTLTSFAEIGVPLLLGNESKIGLKSITKGISDSGKEWWGKQKQNFGVGNPNIDVRPANRRDLNAFMTSVNLAAEDRAIAIYGQAVSKPATKIQNFFFKSIGLHDWTRFVQLVGYDMGKNLIYKNLRTIADNPTATGLAKRKDIDIKRMQDELAELGIDYKQGLNWLKRGAEHTDDYFTKEVRAGANRFTNEVVMNPTAASNQKPLIHSLASTKWVYGLMGFVTAFSNGPLRKVLRNLTKDKQTLASLGTRYSVARAASGALFMTTVGLLNYTIRTGGRNFEQLENGEITIEKLIERSMTYAGILGPAEMYFKYTQGKQYESKIMAAVGSVTGPNLTDLIDYINDATQRGVIAENILKRAPFSASLKSLHRETYNKALKYAKEVDKNILQLGPDRPKKENKALPFSEGGFVKGEYEVPNTKENPADRINPYTGEPYEGLFLEDLPFFNLDSRQAFNEGGLSEEERERLTLQAQELMKLDPPLQQTAPVIELLVAGVPKIIYGVGKTGFNLINTLAKESVKKPKPVNYYHGSNLKLKEVTPMGDRATSPDVKDLFQQASYIAKPGDRGLELANFYARGGGFVNVIGKKQFDEVVKKLYNPRNISDELKDKVTKQISMRQAFINKAKTEKVNRNKLGRARREIVDLETLIKPFGSGYISRITPVQRKFLQREGFDGVDVSDDVVAIFNRVPVKSSIRGSLTQRLIDRRNSRRSKINDE